MEFRISQEFAMDDRTFFAVFESFYCSHADLAAVWTDTERVNAVAMKLAEMPWADSAESLRAVQVACAVTGVAAHFDWLETERRARMRRNAAQAADAVFRSLLSAKATGVQR
jgi:hypothetical protein